MTATTGTSTGPRRRVLVTGASRAKGIGAAVAAVHAERGDAVAVHCRADTAAGEAVVASLPGEGHALVTGDLGDPESVARIFDEAVTALGGVDILVNNAAVHIEHPIATTPYAEWCALWERTVNVNLLGAAHLSWCFARHLLDRPEGPAGGRLVMVGSRGGYRGEPEVPAYGASKAGMHALSQSLAVALGPHRIAVAAIAPGFTRTDLTEELLEGPEGKRIVAQHPIGRIAEPRDIAEAVAWFTTDSPGAEWATGAVLDLNGASYLR
ncbi:MULTISPECIES: SDR family oxidoreductase [unclassified Streptomyces]|uniref:SDR family NAD(P)-dependent oxidoreductase n=1 Tax=unclassified Streptomyces TaxID=2593676 RepID=UPI002E0FF0FA|nr:SDR family oxidoreductase [Streptomyces sp. NBC_01186]WSS42720.1 SDR family oxidoreductase [Streptomyces sp. NBC_01187]